MQSVSKSEVRELQIGLLAFVALPIPDQEERSDMAFTKKFSLSNFEDMPQFWRFLHQWTARNCEPERELL
jgi:hypothetical protein